MGVSSLGSHAWLYLEGREVLLLKRAENIVPPQVLSRSPINGPKVARARPREAEFSDTT